MSRSLKRRGSFGRFLLGMIIYAMIFAVVVIAGLRLFWDYIADYEKSRPVNAIEEYIHSFDEEHIRAISADFVSSLDPSVQNADAAEQEVDKVMQQPLSYARKGAESNEKKTVYVISAGDREIGRVVLTRGDNPRFGFAPWTVAEESYDFSFLVDASDEITVPEDWTVAVNGHVLDDSYIVERGIPFESIADLYEMTDYTFPYQCTYRISNYVGSAPFEVWDAAGNPVDLAAGWSEQDYLENCSDAEKQAIDSFVGEFLEYYIQALSNFNRNAYSNYAMVKEYLVPDSDLDQRLLGAIAGQMYAHSNGDKILSISYDRYYKLSDTLYVVDFTYVLDTIGYSGHVESTNNARLFVVQTENGLKATNIYSI